MDSPPLEVLKECVDMALRDTLNGHGGAELTGGLDDLKDVFQLKQF